MKQEEALTLFALYDLLYHKITNREQ